MKKISVLLLTAIVLSSLASHLFARDIKIVGDSNEKPRIYLHETTAMGYLPEVLR